MQLCRPVRIFICEPIGGVENFLKKKVTKASQSHHQCDSTPIYPSTPSKIFLVQMKRREGVGGREERAEVHNNGNIRFDIRLFKL